MNNSDVDKSFLAKMIIFAVMVVIGLVVWLVVENVLLPQESAPDPDYNYLTRMSVEPDLEVGSVQLMLDRRTLTDQDLADFTVYLDDNSDEVMTPDLVIKRLRPVTPFDIQYIIDFAATESTDIFSDL